MISIYISSFVRSTGVIKRNKSKAIYEIKVNNKDKQETLAILVKKTSDYNYIICNVHYYDKQLLSKTCRKQI